MDYLEIKVKIEPLEVGRDIMVAELAEIGFESFVETEDGVEAYIQKGDFNKGKLDNIPIVSSSQFKVDIEVVEIKEQNWNEVWEKSFEPIKVNNQCYIKAPFHPSISSMEYTIEIEPKMSFGTGHHETTHLMIQELLDMNLDDKTVLDMGCGTGVLAILCELKKASTITAIDIDEWAYQNTIENIFKNKCEKIEVLKGGAELLQNNNFHVVIANINRNILLNDMEKYSGALKTGGEILLSGFFSSDKDMLIEEAEKYGLMMMSDNIKNDWTLLHLKKS